MKILLETMADAGDCGCPIEGSIEYERADNGLFIRMSVVSNDGFQKSYLIDTLEFARLLESGSALLLERAK